MSGPDLERYRRHVAHFDMPEERKTELLRAVWRIMQSFVDRAFGDDPVQQVIAPEGKSSAKDDTHGRPVIDLVPETTLENDKKLTGAFRHEAGRGSQGK